MAVYVDNLVFQKVNGRKKYCHLTADSLEEMHIFCLNVGIGKHFFHTGANHPHYDLTEYHRKIAVDNGAIEVSSREIVRISKRI